MNRRGVFSQRFENQKGLAPVLIILLIAVALGGYLVFTNYLNLSRVKSRDNQTKITQPQLSPSPSSVTHESTTSAEMANWKTYRNGKYGFEFKYPVDLQVEEQEPTFIWYQYNSTEIALQKNGKDTSLPFITLGIANNASIAAYNVYNIQECGDSKFCPSVPFEIVKLNCEQYYKTKALGAYDGITTESYGRLPFRYVVSLVGGQKACAENTSHVLGESVSHKEIVFYAPNNTRFQFRAFLGYSVNLNAILNATDVNLKELEQQKVIYAGSSDTVQLMNQILSTFKFLP